jgi:hypothetical protein
VKPFDRIALRVDHARRDTAERTLTEDATRLSLDELRSVLRRAEAVLDPDGLEPAIAEMHGERSVKITQDPSGMTVLTARLDPETAAPVVAVIEGIVTHQLRASRGRHTPDGLSVDAPVRPAVDAPDAGPVLPESRSLPLGGGSGIATVDGLEQPLDAGSARRIAASAGIIPAVLGSRSEVLDLGRTARHFTLSQRLALVERDGGCCGCHLPPAFTEAHHLRWWARDAGRTDLDEGVLLCSSCHHRVHSEGWEVRIEKPSGGSALSGTVWFIPPAHIDPTRTPSMGGRQRFDPLVRNLTGQADALPDVVTAR